VILKFCCRFLEIEALSGLVVKKFITIYLTVYIRPKTIRGLIG
jgi:hypothetical protein